MILVTTTYEIVTPESAENGEAEESGFLSEDIPYGFRELVDAMRGGDPSSWPRAGARDWVTHVEDVNYRDGSQESRSLHLSHKNSPRAAKYWILAMRAAGVTK
jgi:hypothetical protein